jgi:hypothetical protein
LLSPNEPTLNAEWQNPHIRRWAIVGGVAVLLCVLLIGVVALRKPFGESEQAKAPAQNSVEATPDPGVTSPTPPPPTPTPSPSRSDRTPPRSDATPPPVRPAPPVATVEPPLRKDTPRPPAPKPPTYDQFGNQVGADVGLGQQNEFKGQRLLFWGGHSALPKVFFGPNNPLWKAFEQKGFSVRREFGAFKPDWLENTDQLWILSTSTLEAPAATAEQLEELVKLSLARNPPGKRPFGWSDKSFLSVEHADLEVSFSPRFPLNEEALQAVEKFIKVGKGVCLLADNDPYTNEAGELATRLYGAGVTGNYPGQKIAYVRQRELPPEVISRFRGAYAVDDHPLLRDVNFVYEGITISHVDPSDKLEVAMKASDGQPLLVVSKVPGERVVIDCGFTRYCHGTTDETSFIQKTAGTVRLAQNIAAYLAGKDGKRP